MKEIENLIDKYEYLLPVSYDISKIEREVDKLIEKHFEKFFPEKLSLIVKDKNIIYYLRKKRGSDKEKLSEKIAEKAAKNLKKISYKESKKTSKSGKESGEANVVEKHIEIGDLIEIVKKEETKEPNLEIDVKNLKTDEKEEANRKDEEKKIEIGKEKTVSESKEVKRRFSFLKKKRDIEEEKIGIADISIPNVLKFRVENPQSKEEIELIDKKITETPELTFKDINLEDAEIKAHDLVKRHIDNRHIKIDKEPFHEEEKKPEPVKESEFLIDAKDEGEYVFFDEHESFEGWSPHISEKEKKELPKPYHGKPEFTSNDLRMITDVELPKEALSVKSVTLEELGFSKSEWEELDFYPLHEPYAYVEILRDRETLEKRYFVVEVEITKEEEEILDFIKETIHNMGFDIEQAEAEGEKKYISDLVEKIIEDYNININETSKNKILYYLIKSSFGYGKIDALMRDPNIEDISCDGAGIPVFLYHRKYGSLKSNIQFDTEEELSSFVYKLAQKCGKHISVAEPMLDATLPDGSRIQMTLSDEVTAKGSTFTIRKFREEPFSPTDLLENNTMSSEMLAYLWLAVENGINILFAGGTASGKTTALNAVSLFIPPQSKIVSIEETREINLPHPNWIPGVARTGFSGMVVGDKVQGEIDMYDLMKAALRQRPEYILVGEIRGKEAYVLFQAMATGHATYSTVHADSAQSLIHRLEGKPINIPRVMLQSLDIICLHTITRIKNTRARRCKQIVEIIDIDPTTKEILTNEVFRWDPIEDKFIYTGKSYVLERIRVEKDLTKEEMIQELRNRQLVIEWMNKNNIRNFREVANIVARYMENPSEILKEIEKTK